MLGRCRPFSAVWGPIQRVGEISTVPGEFLTEPRLFEEPFAIPEIVNHDIDG